MTPETFELINQSIVFVLAALGAIITALWVSMVIWAFRDMRSRSRDPFAQLLATLVVALLPIIGIVVYFILRPPNTLAESYERALEEEALLQEIERKPSCPKCSHTVEKDWMACPECHVQLKKICQDCGRLNELSWDLCPMCANGALRPQRRNTPLIIREEAPPPLKSYKPRQLNGSNGQSNGTIHDDLDELSQTRMNRPINLDDLPLPSKKVVSGE